MAPATDSTRRPTLWVDLRAWRKIMTYVRHCHKEVNGFGYLQVLDPLNLLLAHADDVFITDQVVTGGSADVDEHTLGRAVYQASRANRSHELHLQWHSHVNMQAYHSETDMAAIDEYRETGSQWMVSIVFNKKGEYVARLDSYTPLHVSAELTVQFYVPDEDELVRQCVQDLRTHVQQVVYVPDEDAAVNEDEDEEGTGGTLKQRPMKPALIGIFDQPPGDTASRQYRLPAVLATPTRITS